MSTKGESNKKKTPNRSFQSAFLHVYSRLSDPSFADSCYRENVIVMLCKCIQQNITNIHKLQCVAESGFYVL